MLELLIVLVSLHVLSHLRLLVGGACNAESSWVCARSASHSRLRLHSAHAWLLVSSSHAAWLLVGSITWLLVLAHTGLLVSHPWLPHAAHTGLGHASHTGLGHTGLSHSSHSHIELLLIGLGRNLLLGGS